MKFKNILQILISYRLSLIKIIFFELLYLAKGNKGNKFTFSKNDIMTDNTLKNIQCIETYNTSDKKGYSIYYVNKK